MTENTIEPTTGRPRKGDTPRDILLTFRVRQATIDQVDSLAEKHGKTRSDMMRTLLRLGVDAHNGGKR